MPEATRTLEKLANQIAGTDLGRELGVEAWSVSDTFVEAGYALGNNSVVRAIWYDNPISPYGYASDALGITPTQGETGRSYRETQARNELNKVLSHLNEKEQRGDKLSEEEKELKQD